MATMIMQFVNVLFKNLYVNINISYILIYKRHETLITYIIEANYKVL